MFAGVIHTVKCIFKKHDIDLISEFVIIIIGMCIAVSISSGDNRASLIIDLSATKYLEED